MVGRRKVEAAISVQENTAETQQKSTFVLYNEYCGIWCMYTYICLCKLTCNVLKNSQNNCLKKCRVTKEFYK